MKGLKKIVAMVSLLLILSMGTGGVALAGVSETPGASLCGTAESPGVTLSEVDETPSLAEAILFIATLIM